MYKVFTDFHHAALLNSLIMLFENRLGGQVFRPIGTEWHEQGFWKLYEHPATVQQYLGIGGATPDGTARLNDPFERIGENGKSNYQNGLYYCQDIDSGFYNKAITLEAFYEIDIDIVIASLPQHIVPFSKLCAQHPNKPKLIYQIGNMWNVEQGMPVKNVMASAVVNNVPSDVHFISYHQEFSLEDFYYDENSIEQALANRSIASFVNCFSGADIFASDWRTFNEIERAMPEWDFKCYGGQCRDGSANGSKEVADFMRRSTFIWHTKRGGDGYGHVLFNTGAVARPTIAKLEYYQGKLGEKLLIDGETCIAIDNMSDEAIKNKIEFYSESSTYTRLCKNVYNNFSEKVNFNKEEYQLREFLENLL